jgi:hypothetical protein
MGYDVKYPMVRQGDPSEKSDFKNPGRGVHRPFGLEPPCAQNAAHSRLSLPRHILRLLICAQADKTALAQMPVCCPFRVLKLSDELRYQPYQSFIFAAVRPAPYLPSFACGRFANGHSLTSSGFIFLSKFARDTRGRPLRACDV